MSEVTRRHLLAVPAAGGVALAAAGALGAEAEAMPELRFPLGQQGARTSDGGSAKEATVAEFPVSRNLAGVLMDLDAGGLREMHWHANAAEWAYMIRGHARICVIDPQGRSEVVDFDPGDIWYFPRGHGHAIQGLGPDGCQFMLVFDNGAFSEFATFSLTDWLALTPKDVLQRNLRLPPATLDRLPKKEVYIVKGEVPPPLPAQAPVGSLHSPPLSHFYPMQSQAPREFAGGDLRVVSAREFPISATMTGATMRLVPGALRELHWHPNADEWQYVLRGRVRMTVFGSKGRASTLDLGQGDVGYVPQGYGHYLANEGDADCELLLVFNSGEYQEIGLSAWLAANPPDLLAANLGLDAQALAELPKSGVFIVR